MRTLINESSPLMVTSTSVGCVEKLVSLLVIIVHDELLINNEMLSNSSSVEKFDMIITDNPLEFILICSWATAPGRHNTTHSHMVSLISTDRITSR